MKHNNITYDKLFWLFLFGNVLGVIIEGVFCLITKGHWENHVVSVFGAFNIVYGTGAVMFYVGAAVLKRRSIAVRVIILMLAATLLELICGLLLKNGLGMRAWNYENSFMNYKGVICLGFTLVWGLAALIFCCLYSHIDTILNVFKGRAAHIACIALSVFMVFNLAATGASIVRWSARHYGFASESRIGREIDNEMPDEWMQARFVEWEFVDVK